MISELFEAVLNEAAGKKPRYKAPDGPYDKFKSDLAREFTAKHFPFKYGSKQDKKCFRTPGYYLGYSYDGVPSFEYGSGSDTLWLTPKGHGTGIFAVVESEGKGEKYFQNTNENFADEGYETDQNFYYQGPTWSVTRYHEDNGKSEVFKSGLKRNELADAIIELYRTQGKANYDEMWQGWMDLIEEKIKGNQEYIAECNDKLENDTSADWQDSWFRDRIQKNINSAEKTIKEFMELQETPALPPDLDNSGAETERKSRTWFYGTVQENPDPDGPNGRYASWLYWMSCGFNKAEAIRNVKHSYYCSRRASTGCSQKPMWLAASVKCSGEIEGDPITWKENMEKRNSGRVMVID